MVNIKHVLNSIVIKLATYGRYVEMKKKNVVMDKLNIESIS